MLILQTAETKVKLNMCIASQISAENLHTLTIPLVPIHETLIKCGETNEDYMLINEQLKAKSH